MKQLNLKTKPTRKHHFTGLPPLLRIWVLLIATVLGVGMVSTIDAYADMNDNWSDGATVPRPSLDVKVSFSPMPKLPEWPSCSVSGNLAFGNKPVGYTYTLKMVISGYTPPSGPGTASLSIASIDYPSGFSGDWSGGVVPDGEPKEVTVRFSPTSEQSYGGIILIHANTFGDLMGFPTEISCSGTGVVSSLSTEGDFDGDSTADLATFQLSTGNWDLLFSGGGQSAQAFGSSAMVPVPADYDGDGMLDYGLYRPSNGTWYILHSGGGSKMKQFGWSKTVPVPGDYDGDGRTDLAIYYPNQVRWYFLYSGGSQGENDSIQFGGRSDIPVPADYDGDGAMDMAVYRPSSGYWYMLYSGGGYRAVRLGWKGTLPVPGDYDGDGIGDIAVLSRATSTWCIDLSSGGSLILAFGYKTMKPVQADYDGDGATDIAMYHEASGTWYIRESSTGRHCKVVHGGPGQIPVLLYPQIHSWFGLP